MKDSDQYWEDTRWSLTCLRSSSRKSSSNRSPMRKSSAPPESWWESMGAVAKKTDTVERDERNLRYILALLPMMRYWYDFNEAMEHGRSGELYYQSGHNRPHAGQYQEDMDYITRVVPSERLNYYDIKDGWGPLCQNFELQDTTHSISTHQRCESDRPDHHDTSSAWYPIVARCWLGCWIGCLRGWPEILQMKGTPSCSA